MTENRALNELDITSPEVYTDPDALRAVHARLRREAPVPRIDRVPCRPLRALTRHAEITKVSLEGEAQWMQSNFVGRLQRPPVRYRMA